MTLGVGIVGLPNVGKTTLFNALTRAGAGVASYAFSTVEPNTAMVEVPDKRLDVLAQMYKPKKVTPTVMKFVDVAGLVAGASRGEGMGNQFLSAIRDLSEQAKLLKSFSFPTAKPVLYVANIGEDQIGKDTAELQALRDEASAEHAEVIPLSARLEAEIRELPDEEAGVFLEDAGLKEAALPTFIHAAYRLLNLVTFLTAGDPEVRAWTVRQGSRAPEAAGVIHSDIERGFIKAEIVAYDDLIAAGSYATARERGKVRLEGRDYVIKDGDVCLFRFNV